MMTTIRTYAGLGVRHEAQVACTASEHEAMAETYRKKMAEYQKEIEFHRAMLAIFKKRVRQLPKEPHFPASES